MEVCPLWMVVLYFVATVQIVNTSVNIALGKTTDQSSKYNDKWVSSTAVDGCTSTNIGSDCCTHTELGQTEAWWQVHLQTQSVIETVNIIYRDEGSAEQKTRFAGYQIYLSNTTNWINSDRCYTDTSSTASMVGLTPQITSCTGNTRYLTIYVDRRTKNYTWYSTEAVLELCEVEVYGCPVGNYGNSNCDSDCDVTCVNSLCHPNTGQCTYCAPGFYKSGRVCTACPTNCLNGLCNMETGVCSACVDGYHGSQCDQLCPAYCQGRKCDQTSSDCTACMDGYHGNKCDQPCPATCRDRICDQTSSDCTACMDGYHGNKCDQQCPTTCRDRICDQASSDCTACVDGYHGNKCDQSCSANCQGRICDQTSSDCTDCVDGYYGNQCDQSCPANCQDKKCDQTSGVCIACINGYHGSTCDKKCAANCRDKICDQGNGVCQSCVDGYHGSQCNQSCPDNCQGGICEQYTRMCSACANGYYGNYCDQQCPEKCKDMICHRENGKCEDCVDRFFGPFCVACSPNCSDPVCNKTTGYCDQCRVGFHGNTCNETCPANCKNSRCSQGNGSCTTGCELGFHGNMCQHMCPINCKEDVCSQKTGICEECKPGKYGDTCDSNCTSNCYNKLCNQTTGQCTECEPGFYTTECNQTCPSNCKDSRCDRNSGECSGCDDGFHGSNCSGSCPTLCSSAGCSQNNGQCIACINGYYGTKCKEKCGQCIGEACDMENGTCDCRNGWEGETCITQKAMELESEDQTATYAGGAVGGVVVIALVAIATFIILRRKRLSSYKESSREDSEKPLDKLNPSPAKLKTQTKNDRQCERTNGEDDINGDGHGYVNMQTIEINTGGDATYGNVDNTDAVDSSVSIHDLRSIIDLKMVNKAAAFQEEFKSFPWGAVHPHEAGKTTSNKPKNRFKTTFPYDHSRVILEPIGNDTSYTNANYLDSVEATKQYIASQGPKPNTLDDFWRMVWQVSAGKIVMLTNIMEGGNVKCHKYWPDEGEPLSTPTFQLNLDRERTYAFYAIRDISVVKKKTKEERLVQQFHFTTWPDHGTPDTLELVLFHRRVTSYETQLTGQMVVHCSAGLGRTGTFIGLDALLSYGKTTGQVDIPRYIRTMRKDRMNMIQNYEQYIALHELLVEGFNLQESHILRINFLAVLAAKCPKNKPANQTKIFQEFKALQTFNPNYTPNSYKAALLKANKNKNRNMEILAADKFRAFLQSQPSNRTDYINAIMIQSYTSRSGYLMTQFPLEDTVDDFWTMVCDYSCENIVVLGQPSKECWLGGNDSTTSAAFTITTVDERFTSDDLTILEYQVSGESNSREATVRIFTMKQWSSESLLPTSDSSLLLLLEQLDSRRKSNNTKPVVVMCRDGCTQSGLFCCISNIRDQMKMDDEVDIFQTARQLKKRRPEALENVKQYQYCYKILGQYLDSTDVYVN